MTHSLFFRVTRPIALGSETGAALLAGSSTPAIAQTTESDEQPAAAAAPGIKPGTIEQPISTLRSALEITPDQEPRCNAAQAMRDIDGLKKSDSAFKTLYDGMPGEQKRNADREDEKHLPSRASLEG